MDFALSPQHAEIQRTVRDFAERRIVPVADELERKGEFPHEIIREAAGLGLLGVPYPEEIGGTGLDSLAYAITVEELSRASGSVGIIVSAHTSLGCNPIWLAGTDAQKERYLRPMASGQVIGAYGLTEPGAGSATRAARKTRARRDGDEWVLNGSKRFITNAGRGRHVHRHRGDRARARDSGKISAFIVEADTPGFSIGRMEEKMGLHASNTGELIFEDCRIPAENLLGEEGEGDKLFLKTLDGGRIGIGAMALGLAQAAYEAASAYAKERQQFGRPIGAFQGVAFMIADMATADRRRSADGLSRGVAEGRRQAVLDRGGHGQALRLRGRARRHERRDPGARRLRLHHRVPRRALPPRREADRDRGGDERDPADGDRPQPARPASDVAR